MAVDKKRVAESKYAKKVCKDYLGISEEACKKAFEKLYANMKAAFEAFIG